MASALLSLLELALALAGEKKELPVIAKAVGKAYDAGPKQFIQWDNPATNTCVRCPAWSLESITRHLLYCDEFGLYNETITHIFQKIISSEQSRVMNPVDDEVITERKTELFKSISAYSDWLVKRARVNLVDAQIKAKTKK